MQLLKPAQRKKEGREGGGEVEGAGGEGEEGEGEGERDEKGEGEGEGKGEDLEEEHFATVGLMCLVIIRSK